MKAELAEKLIERMDTALRLAGTEDYGIAMTRTLVLLNFFVEKIEMIKTKDDLRRVLHESGDPDYVEEKLLLASFRFLPQLLKYGAKKLAQSTAVGLPDVPGGRPSCDEHKKRAVVDYVGKLHTDGYSMKVAKKRAADKFHISESTVQRAWDNRSKSSGGEADFNSVVRWLASSN